MHMTSPRSPTSDRPCSSCQSGLGAPEWLLLPASGASIDLEKTSHDYEDANTAYFWNRFSFWNYARPPTVILEVGLEPGSQNGTRGRTLGKGPNSSLEVGPSCAEDVALGGPCWAEDGPC